MLLKYFCYKKEVQIKLLELQALPVESSEILNEYFLNLLIELCIVSKCIELYSDITNTNFGG